MRKQHFNKKFVQTYNEYVPITLTPIHSNSLHNYQPLTVTHSRSSPTVGIWESWLKILHQLWVTPSCVRSSTRDLTPWSKTVKDGERQLLVSTRAILMMIVMTDSDDSEYESVPDPYSQQEEDDLWSTQRGVYNHNPLRLILSHLTYPSRYPHPHPWSLPPRVFN